MTSGKISNRTIEPVLEGQQKFSIEDARRIAAAVGLNIEGGLEVDEPFNRHEEPRLAQLAYKLNNAAFDFRWIDRVSNQPTDKQVLNQINRISKLCKKLRAEVTDAEGKVFDHLGSGALFAVAALEAISGADAVKDVVAGIAQLERWCATYGHRLETTSNHSPAPRGRRRDEAWHSLATRLSGIYATTWFRETGLSRQSDQTPTGPYFRFVKSVVDVLAPGEYSDSAIAETIRQHQMKFLALD